MKEKLQGGLAKIKGLYTGDKKSKSIKITAVVLAAVVVFAVVMAVILNNRPYEVLFTGLSTDEASAVVSKLEEYGATDYKIEGDTIKVPQADEPDLKAKLLLDGYPKSGFNYDTYFNNVGIMASESDRETVRNYELQDRMAAVIRCFDGVKDAVVNISAGSDQRYVLDSDNAIPASAAVVVTMQDGGALPEEYVEAIGNLVARSVQGLEFDSISISDSLGNTYTPGGDSNTSASASDLKMRLENQVNNRVRSEVLQVLTPVYGNDNVRVSVNSTVDVSHSVSESTEYTTPQGAPAGEGIIGHREYDQSLTRDGNTTNGGVVGAETNADIQTYMDSQNAVTGNETSLYNSGSVDYDVNKTTEQREQNSGVVTDIMIAVTINQDAAGDVGTAQLTSHIARAAGISTDQQADKINILVAPFYNSTPADNTQGGLLGNIQLPKWALYTIAGVGGLLLLLIVLLIIASSRRRKKQQALLAVQQQQEEEAAAIAAHAQAMAAEEAAENILDIKNEKNMELKRDIRKFTEENPEIAAQMIRTWLKGEDAHG
ncbi:MAG: flagellar basal-body MS-ring/collar protein FliF [Butyricicoccus sp.]|nr:flagellar basal-body MS-ring/collar protein FliF [Butyricicoccus sp.]